MTTSLASPSSTISVCQVWRTATAGGDCYISGMLAGLETLHFAERRRLSTELALIPLACAVHNAEEALTIGTHLPRLRDALGAWALYPVSLPTEQQYLLGLAVVTGLSFALVAVAWRWDLASVGLVVLQAVMALNVLSHVAMAIAVGSYVPGLWTALLIQVPMGVVVLRRVHDAGWLSRAHWRRVGLAALLLHGPGLWLLLAWLQTA